MHPFPHHYHVQAAGGTAGAVQVSASALPTLESHAPPEFGGPPGYWSPEHLLVAAIADCYVLSFRAVARACKLPWSSLQVQVEGVLDRVDGVTRFVRYVLRPELCIAGPEAEALARTVLDKAKRTCLITNSLTGECVLEANVAVCEPAA